MSSEDFQDVLDSDDKFTTARKPKETVETVSAWSLRTKPDIMNNVVRGNRFPAYKVADSCLESGHITPKQRRAITNVYVHAYA